MNQKTHLASLDFLRGLAALAVCIMHFTNGFSGYLPNGNIVKSVGAYGTYGVHVFFIISGIVIPYSMDKGNYSIRNFKTFMLKRITRIEPPYIASILIILCLVYLSALSPYYRGAKPHIDILNLVLHLGYLNVFLQDPKWLNAVYWTLAVEFQYYIIIALVFPFISSARKYSWIIVFVIFNTLSLLVNSGGFVFYFSLYFSVGIISYKFIVKAIDIKIYMAVLVILLTLIFLKFHLPGFIAAIIPVLFIFIEVDNPVTRFFGKISYSLYLMHIPFGMRMINISDNFVKDVNLRLLVIAGTLGVTIFVSYLFYLWVELPFKKLSKNISYVADQKKIAAV